MAIDRITLKNEILNGPLKSELAPLVAAQDYQGIASVLNRRDAVTVIVPGSSFNHRELMDVMDPVMAASILDKLEAAAATNSVVKWVLYSIKGDAGIDLSRPNARAQIDALVAAGVLTASEAAALKALAERQGSRAELLFGIGTVVTAEDVSHALNGGY